MFEVVLAATDGSGHGTRATETAADIAAKYDARLLVLSVVQQGPLPKALLDIKREDAPRSQHPLLARVPAWFDEALQATRRGTGETHAVVEALAREALNHAEQVAKQAGVLQPGTILEHGDPARAIVACAKREDADLIVLGRRGLSSFSELVLGSVSHKVAQQTDRSCLTVP